MLRVWPACVHSSSSPFGRMHLFSRLLSLRSLSVNGSCWLHGDGFPNPHQLLWGSKEWVMGCWQQWTSLSFSGFSLNLISWGSTLCLQERDSSTINFGCFSSSFSERWCLPYTAASRWVPCFPGTPEGTCFPQLYLGPSICTQLPGGSIPAWLSPACFVGQSVPFFSLPRGAHARSEGKAPELLQPNNSKPTCQRRWFNIWSFFKASCTRGFLRPEP